MRTASSTAIYDAPKDTQRSAKVVRKNRRAGDGDDRPSITASSTTYLTERIHRLLDARQIDRAFVHPHFDGIIDDTLDSNKDLHGC